MEPRLLRPPSPTRYKVSSQPGRSSTGTLPLRYAYDDRDRPRDDLYSQDSRYRPASHDRPYVIPSHMVVRQPSSQYRSPRSSADYVLSSSSREPRHSAERLVLVPRRERERSKERERPEEYYLPSSRKSSATSTSASRTSSSRTPLSTIDSNTSASGEPTRYRYAPTSTILEKDEPDTHRPRHHSEQYYLSPSGASVQRRTQKYEEDYDRAKQYVAARKAQGSRHDAVRRYEYEEPTSRAVRDGYSYTGVGEQAARDLAETKFRYPDVRERRRSSAMYDEPEYRSRLRESHGPPVSTRGFDRIEQVERAGEREHARHGSKASLDSRREFESGYLQPPVRREERRREGSLDDSRRGHRRHASLDDRGDLRSLRRSYIEPSVHERERDREHDERRDKERRRDERDRESDDDEAHRRRYRTSEKEKEKEKEKEEEKKKHRHGAEIVAAGAGALGLAAVEGLKSRSRREKDESSEDDGPRRERKREKEKEKEKDKDREINEEPRRSRRHPDETEEERRERRARRKQRDEEGDRPRDGDENPNGARDVSRAEDAPRRRRVRRRRHPEEQEEETSPSSTSSDEQARPRRDLAIPTATAAATAGLSTLAVSERERSYSRPRRPTVLTPSTSPPLPKSILRKPTVRFPEPEEDTRPGVAPHKDDTEKDHTKRWTSINGTLVDPRALAGKERFEVRDGYVLVLRVLSEEEVQYYADVSYAIRVEDTKKAEQARRRDAPLQLTDHAHNHPDDDSDERERDRHDDPYRSRPRRSKASTYNSTADGPRNDKDDDHDNGNVNVDVNVNDPYARPRRRRDDAPTTNVNTNANTSAKRDAIGEKTYVPSQGDFYRDKDEPPGVPGKVPLDGNGNGNANGQGLAAKVEDEA